MPSTPRLGQSWLGVCAFVAVVASVPIGWFWMRSRGASAAEAGDLVHVVKRAEFVHVITDKGEIESSSNDEIRCQVQAQSGSMGTAILSIVAEGTNVEPGDELLKFDSAVLDAERQKQKIACNASAAKVAKAGNTLKTATIALKEYEEGLFKQEEQTGQADVLLKEENHVQAQKRLEFSTKLAAKGYIAHAEVAIDRLAEKKAATELEAARIKLQVLREFTREKKILELQSTIDTARAELEAEVSTHELDLEKLRLIEAQIAKCTVTAPVAGQVVYPEPFWSGNSRVQVGVGVTVREGQLVLRLPDFKKMQVNAKVHESKVHRIVPDMPATLRIEPLPQVGDLTGKVIKVKEYPEEDNFWRASKEYSVLIEIPDAPKSLRPGMTAEVKILVEQRSNELLVPVQAVIERDGRQFCAVRNADGWQPREIKTSSSNDKFLVVDDGLTENETVLLNLRDRADSLGLADDESPDEALARP